MKIFMQKISSKITHFLKFARIVVAAALSALPLAFVAPVSAVAQHSQMDFKQLTQEEGRAVLREFRKFRFPADYCMDFEIVHKPRKSDDETVYAGTMWGTWDDGAIIRMEIRKAGDSVENTKKFLIKNGEKPELWTLDENGKAAKIDGDSAAPFFDGLIFTPFDVQTPFLFWEDFTYETTKRSRGRPVHFFSMTPPENFKKSNPDIGSVRIGIDRAYNVLMSVEVLDSDGARLKNFFVGSVKKIQDLYTFRELELRDERSRDRDTLVVKRAAMRLRFDPEFFSPENLAEKSPNLPDNLFEKLD